MTDLRPSIRCAILACLLAGSGTGAADPLPTAEPKNEPWQLMDLPDGDDEHLNISAIALDTDRSLMVLGSDEKAAIQILLEQDKGEYKLGGDGNYALDSQDGTEIDIEGIARDGQRYWVIGSHSLKRKGLRDKDELLEKQAEKQADGKTLAEDYNHRRMASVAVEPTREWLYRVKIDQDGRSRHPRHGPHPLR